jgi:hypothetical protein
MTSSRAPDVAGAAGAAAATLAGVTAAASDLAASAATVEVLTCRAAADALRPKVIGARTSAPVSRSRRRIMIAPDAERSATRFVPWSSRSNAAWTVYSPLSEVACPATTSSVNTTSWPQVCAKVRKACESDCVAMSK